MKVEGGERERGGEGRWTVGVSLGSESVRAGRAKGGLLGGGGFRPARDSAFEFLKKNLVGFFVLFRLGWKR